MQHQEMIQPSHFGVVSRTCLFCFVGLLSVFTLI